MCFYLSLNSSERVSKGFFFRLTVQNKTSSIFIFCEMVRKRIVFFSEEWLGPKLQSSQCFFFLKIGFETEFPALLSSAEWLGMESELFYLPWNDSNSSTKWFETEF